MTDRQPSSDAGPDPLRIAAVNSAVWSLARYGGGQILRLATNLVLARLLSPDAFGLLALVAVLMQALEMFSDIGVQPAIIRSPNGDDPEFLDTAWTLQVIRGVGIWAIAAGAAIPFAAFYEEPDLRTLIPTLASISLISAVSTTKQHTLNRNLSLKRLTIIELLAQTAGLGLMVGMALRWPNVWSLVVGAIGTALLRTVASFVALEGRNNRFRWNPVHARELFNFGRWIAVSTALTFTAQFADRLIFGKLVTIEMLGIFSIAKMIASLPSEVFSQLAAHVVFPVYSRVVARGDDIKQVFRSARTPLLVLGGWVSAGLIAGGPTIIELLYDDRYAAAGWMVQVLTASAWFHLLESVTGGVLLTMGLSKWIAIGTGAKTLAIAALIPAGFYLYGMEGAVIGLAASEVAKYAVSVYAAARIGLPSVRQDTSLSALVAATALIGYGAHLIGGHVLVRVPIIAVVVTVCWIPLLWPLLQRVLRERLLVTTP